MPTPPSVTPLPDVSRVLSAIDAYLRVAYDGGPPPLVRAQLAGLRARPAEKFFDSPLLWREDQDDPPGRYALRLGNRHYPHMRLMLERSPDRSRFLFRVDTHDRHICPPSSSPEFPAFAEMMEKNQRVAEQIESAWAEQGIPTFKTYLREDLARRQAAAAREEGDGVTG